MTPEELAKKEIEKLKEQDDFSFPIDPFKILKKSGVYVTLREFEKLDGIILNDENNNTIVGINKNTNLQRQRFTAAHEYCHFIKDLKREVGKYDLIECLKYSNSKIEKYANDFAGYFLMPTNELKKICKKYKNEEGYVEFESVTKIAEYFGVSFQSCLNRIAYGLNLIEGDISTDSLKQRRKEYKVNQKRKELISNTIDTTLLANIIESMEYIMTDLNKYTGQKFLQNYIYYDNKLEGIEMPRSELNYILADLNYNGANSKFFNSNDERTVMTLGNLELQKYVITTKDKIKINKCKHLHSLLYKYVPYPEDNGKYRNEDALLSRGTTQPVPYYKIQDNIKELDNELQLFIEHFEEYNIKDFIEKVALITYKFIVIHPFRDGNGRISRAIMNWLLSIKGLPPIYIDDTCREEYYKALSEIDLNKNIIPFITLIERRIINTMMELHKYLFIDTLED